MEKFILGNFWGLSDRHCKEGEVHAFQSASPGKLAFCSQMFYSSFLSHSSLDRNKMCTIFM